MEGGGSRTQNRPPSSAHAPRRLKTRDCVAAPVGSHSPRKGAPSGTSRLRRRLTVITRGDPLRKPCWPRRTIKDMGWWAVSGSPLSPPRELALTHTHA